MRQSDLTRDDINHEMWGFLVGFALLKLRDLLFSGLLRWPGISPTGSTQKVRNQQAPTGSSIGDDGLAQAIT
jgi:hypothetical protein